MSSLSSQFIQRHNSEGKQVPLDLIWVPSITTYVASYCYKKVYPLTVWTQKLEMQELIIFLVHQRQGKCKKETTLLSSMTKLYYNDGLGCSNTMSYINHRLTFPLAKSLNVNEIDYRSTNKHTSEQHALKGVVI